MNNPLRTHAGEQIALAISVAGSASELARRLLVSPQAVCFWRDGKRRFPEALGARLEKASNGQVTRQSMWPEDWMHIWPELCAKADAVAHESPNV